MDLKESISVVSIVCAKHGANLETHQQIQTALQNIRTALFPPEKPTDKPKEGETGTSE